MYSRTKIKVGLHTTRIMESGTIQEQARFSSMPHCRCKHLRGAAYSERHYPMNVGIVTQWEFPIDREVRVRKIASSLSTSGYSVFIIARKKNEETKQDIGYATMHRFGYFSAWYKINRLLSIPFPFSLFWILWIVQVGREQNFGLIIIRDLRLALPGIVAARILHIPVILDFGENFPGLVTCFGNQKLSQYITRNRGFISRLERICASIADYVWVVVEENRERLIDAGIDEAKIAIVSNTPELILSNMDRDSRYSDRSDNRFRMIFVGILDSIRGIDLILRSIPYLSEKGSDVEFIIVGDGDDKARLVSLAKTLKIEDVVKFTGWVESERVPRLIRESDVGLIPHELNELTQTTIPNKLFDYMIAGIPIVSTDMKPIRRVIESENCGFIAPNDPERIAETILRLKASPKLCILMGENGRKAVLERYNWAEDSKAILRTMKHLADRGKWRNT